MRTLAVFAVLVFAAVPLLPVLSEAPPVGQDWIVTEDTVVSDQVIYMGTYDLRVREGATLELRNVKLRFNQTSSDGGIFVERGAALEMDDCALNDVSKSVRPWFLVQGTVELTGCQINRIGYYNHSGGLEIEGGQATVTRCRFANMTYYGLYCTEASVAVEGSAFLANDYASIASYASALDVRNCTFEGYGGGLEASSSEVYLYRSAFKNYYDCARFDQCSVTVVGCAFEHGLSSLPKLPPVGTGPFVAGPAEIGIVGCNFTQNSDGCHLLSYSDSSSYVGALLRSCTRGLIHNCSFFGFSSDGVMVSGLSPVVVRDCSFDENSQGVYAYGHTRDRCTIRDCRFTANSTQSVALYVSSGGVTFSNNTVLLGSESYYYSIRCYGASTIQNNTIVSAARSEYPGIAILSMGFSDRTEVSGNLLDGFSDGIYCSVSYGTLVAEKNIIRNCSNGVNLSGNAELRGNVIDTGENGIRMTSYGRTDWPDRIEAADNVINCSLDGIRVMADSELRITENRVRTGATGIKLDRAPWQANSVVVSRNRIEAGSVGIELETVPTALAKSSLDNNTVLGARYGLLINRTAIPVADNSMDNITTCGIIARDCAGNLSRAVSSFTGVRSAGALREMRIWSVTLEVRYNINPPGDPEYMLLCDDYELKVRDPRGAVQADFDRQNRSLELVEYQVFSNGSRFDFNPYQLTVWSPGKGASRTNVWLTEKTHLVLRLSKGPDLIALGLNLSNRLPVEGELLLICATAQNDGSFNPDGTEANFPNLELRIDDNVLSRLELPVFPNGTSQPLAAAWIATAGWHNATFFVDVNDNVGEVFEDNNRITVPFYVMPLPAGELSCNETEPAAGSPVEFTINFTGEATGFRFDFGDGERSAWLASPRLSHIYLKPGDYVVRGYLVTAMGNVCECLRPLLVMVGNFPSGAAVRAYPDPARSGRPVLFTISITGWEVNLTHQVWYFGDGGYAYSERLSQAEHTFQRPGNYTVECVLGFEDGSGRTYRLAISVQNALPVAAGKVSPASGTAATALSFTSESRDPDGNILSCVWDFGDGGTSLSPFSTHSFGRHGLFTVNLTVQDNLGQWSEPCSFPVQVDNTPPAIRLRPVGGDPAPGSRLQFDGSDTSDIDDPPGALAFSWDFGDGSSATGVKASHAYSKEGRYTVTLTVNDSAEGISTKTATVDVRQAVGLDVGWQLPAFVVGALLAVSVAIFFAIRILTHRHGEHGPPENGKAVALKGNAKRPPRPRP